MSSPKSSEPDPITIDQYDTETLDGRTSDREEEKDLEKTPTAANTSTLRNPDPTHPQVTNRAREVDAFG